VYSGGKVAVRNLTMAVRRGECFGFLGPNGAGKTTAISVWTGLFEPTSGSATVCGHDIRTQMGLIYGLIGVCPQFDILWPLLTVRETLRLYAQLKGVPKAEWDAEADRAAQAVELSRAQGRQVVRLSGGMKRRVSFAISLIAAPEVVFLDEPTTGLDPETKRHIWTLIEAAKPGRSIVLTTHSMEEADALSDRIGIMAYGALRCIGPSLHLKAKFGAGPKVDLVVRDGMREAAIAFVEGARRLAAATGAAPASASDGEVTVREAEGGAAPAKTAAPDDQRGLRVTQLTIALGHDSMPLSALFDAMNARPESSGIEQWALRQTTMEEVFLRIARESEAEPSGSVGGSREQARVVSHCRV
jgi:ABC-type multidrug transport system ATPase subunit